MLGGAFLDTSMVVRYLTDDPPAMAEQAARIIDDHPSLTIAEVALIEAAYVLTSVYRVPREVVVDRLVEMIQRKNVGLACLEKDTAIQALLLCRPSGRVSFADALIWATARAAGAKVIYSFDERFPSDGIEVRSGHAEPGR